MIKNDINDFIEIGPGKVLSGLVKRINNKVLTRSVTRIDDIKKYTMINLKNKVLTGASGGIGGALVKKFISLNSKVLGTGTNSEKLEKLKKEFSEIKNKKI